MIDGFANAVSCVAVTLKLGTNDYACLELE